MLDEKVLEVSSRPNFHYLGINRVTFSTPYLRADQRGNKTQSLASPGMITVTNQKDNKEDRCSV